MEDPLIDQELLLQKFPRKGGWTYAEVNPIQPITKTNFGWVKVKGKIDDFYLEDYSLAPMQGGKLFLPVKADIRKAINKKAGDYVRVTLFKDTSSLIVPQEIQYCLLLGENAFNAFCKLSNAKQREYTKWIYAVKKEDLRAARISKMMDDLTIIKR